MLRDDRRPAFLPLLFSPRSLCCFSPHNRPIRLDRSLVCNSLGWCGLAECGAGRSPCARWDQPGEPCPLL